MRLEFPLVNFKIFDEKFKGKSYKLNFHIRSLHLKDYFTGVTIFQVIFVHYNCEEQQFLDVLKVNVDFVLHFLILLKL